MQQATDQAILSVSQINNQVKFSLHENFSNVWIKGEVASPFQFITTDSSKNFLRAALYFEKPIKGDSLSPIVDYLKKDMLHVLNTLQWNE